MNLLAMYTALFAEKTLQMEFSSAEEAEKFRIQLAKFKLRQDAALKAVDMLEHSHKLSFVVKKDETQDLIDGEVVTWIATICFKQPTVKEFRVKILDE